MYSATKTIKKNQKKIRLNSPRARLILIYLCTQAGYSMVLAYFFNHTIGQIVQS